MKIKEELYNELTKRTHDPKTTHQLIIVFNAVGRTRVDGYTDQGVKGREQDIEMWGQHPVLVPDCHFQQSTHPLRVIVEFRTQRSTQCTTD